MILRYVATDLERPFECTVGYQTCRPENVNARKKAIKRLFTYEFNGLACVQFKTFSQENDEDEI